MNDNNPFTTPKTSIAKAIGYGLFGAIVVLLTIALIAPHMGTAQKVQGAEAAAKELVQEMHKPKAGS